MYLYFTQSIKTNPHTSSKIGCANKTQESLGLSHQRFYTSETSKQPFVTEAGDCGP